MEEASRLGFEKVARNLIENEKGEEGREKQKSKTEKEIIQQKRKRDEMREREKEETREKEQKGEDLDRGKEGVVVVGYLKSINRDRPAHYRRGAKIEEIINKVSNIEMKEGRIIIIQRGGGVNGLEYVGADFTWKGIIGCARNVWKSCKNVTFGVVGITRRPA